MVPQKKDAANISFLVSFPLFRNKFCVFQKIIEYVGVKYRKDFELLTKLVAFDALVTFLV